MENVTECGLSVRRQSRDVATGETVTLGASDEEACVTILDLETMHGRAVGFMKGFAGTLLTCHAMMSMEIVFTHYFRHNRRPPLWLFIAWTI